MKFGRKGLYLEFFTFYQILRKFCLFRFVKLFQTTLRKNDFILKLGHQYVDTDPDFLADLPVCGD